MISIFQSYLKKQISPLLEEDIKIIEIEIEVKIPPQLRDFYLFSNGGDLCKNTLPPSDFISEILSLDGGSVIAEFRSIKENFDFFEEKIEMGDCLFPFAYTSCPWKLYIAHSGENIGKIYISEEKDENRNFIPVRLIANSFLEFLDMME